jgi:hypothetical protein
MKEPGAGGAVAALPFAACFTLLLARVLPIRFEYHPNTLGIVSRATLDRYPLQQETFWLGFAAILGLLLFWLFARGLARAADDPLGQARIEAHGVLALVLALWLPTAAAWIACTGAALVALALARPGARAPASPASPALAEPRTRLRAATALALLAGALLLSALLNPPFWTSAFSVAHRVPDESLLADTFLFHAEMGQHLAWADALARGELHGRDFFCLYGPLYDLGLAGLWQATGRSIAAYKLYVSLGRVAGCAAALLLCAALLRQRWLVLLLPLLVAWVDLRIGLALAGLLLLVLWLRDGRRALALAAGLTAGISLLYSQEFGLALLLTAAAAFALVRAGRAALVFAAGLAAVLVPLLAVYAAQDALAPMLHDLAQYPRYVVAGYGKRPFPSLVAALPLSFAALRGEGALDLRLGYAVPFVCAAALLLSVPVGALAPRRAVSWAREAAAALARDPLRLGTALVALFGALAFRSALGRSDITHIQMVVAPAAVLIVIALDRLVGGWRAAPALRPLLALRALALALLVLHGGFLAQSPPWKRIGYSLSDLATLASEGYAPRGSRRVGAVATWVREHAAPGEAVLFLPDSAAYYYLTERASPIRFVLGHQIVTDAQRAEVLEKLRATPPDWLVWDEGALHLDGIDPRALLGPALVGWLESSYALETRIGKTSILRRREAGGSAG